MRGKNDLIGLTFGELTVKDYHGLISTGKSSRERFWVCDCSCGEKDILASTRVLQKGRKKSCGHINVSKKKPTHKYIIKEDSYAVVFTHSNEPFYIDVEDLEKVLNRTWFKKHQGYICTKINNRMVQLHRYLLNPPDDKVIDHINRIRHDNRKMNLRICEPLNNSWNIGISKKNTSGITGVYMDEYGKWRAEINVNGERIYLGYYDDIEEAYDSRIAAEVKYFGEFQRKKEGDLPLPIINDEDYVGLFDSIETV